MSAPSANNPNEGVLGQIQTSLENTGKYISETIQGKSSEASKEANKEQAKGNIPGQDTLSDRVSGAAGAIGDKLDQHKHETSASANKHSI
ncbi:hypothetical protein ABW19_dt0210368 [Dactylella cylindrospora]|nr:hypothetical protein ABW19_dt0210368 [Dactylella cylindrospora]